MLTLILGAVCLFVFKRFRPAFFRGEVLNKDTPTLVPESVYADLPGVEHHPRPPVAPAG
jgi:hypothetical protein